MADVKKRRKAKMIPFKKKYIKLSEAAEILGVSYSTVYNMFKDGATSVEEMQGIREVVDSGVNMLGGKPEETFLTSKGNLTIGEIKEKHPYNLSHGCIKHRGLTWGWDHKGLWLSSVRGPLGFVAEATKLDGPPRGVRSVDLGVDLDVKNERKKYLKANRTATCFRDRGNIRCSSYESRLKMDNDHPEQCKIARGTYCPNFVGKDLKVTRVSNSSDPIRVEINGKLMI